MTHIGRHGGKVHFGSLVFVSVILTELTVRADGPADAVPFCGTRETLKAAICNLRNTFGQDYPEGTGYLARLEKLSPDNTTELKKLQREALLANPLVRNQPIVFIHRNAYRYVHGPDETMFQPNEPEVRGGFTGRAALKVVDVQSGKTGTILASDTGIIRDPDIYFDAGKILFSMRQNASDSYHLYEIKVDPATVLSGTGSELKQLTFARDVSDIQPVYLPNDRIMFSSTRTPKYIHCQRHLMASLFAMESDGANIHQVGFNTLFEGRSSLMPDGRVLYSRWEYVDKHFSSAYGLWTANPDGTAQQLFYGGLAWCPGAIMDGRMIPGTSRAVCTYGSVHGAEFGAMVIVDPSRGNDGPAPVVHSWPPDISEFLQGWDTMGRCDEYDSFLHVPMGYQDPYPLAEPKSGRGAGTYFLCSRNLAPDNAKRGIFLVDTFGNEVLLHCGEMNCYQPRPLAQRTRPVVMPDRTRPAESNGLFYVYDVYKGPGMEAVKKGSVAAIRIVEAPDKVTYPPSNHGDWNGPGEGDSHHPTATSWNHYNSKRILGTVPVEADGSASFLVPAGRFVYFQLLDSKGRMIHSMRSGTSLMPGERQGCIGCHNYRSAPPTAQSKALQRPPSVLKPWYGPERNFNYAAEVQPVFDRHCTRCHDFGKKPANKINLAADDMLAYNASYVSLMSRSPTTWQPPKTDEPKPLVSTIGSGPLPIVPPYSWGSTRSRLVDMLLEGHHDTRLSDEEMNRIITWIDLNAPYYPDYYDYYSLNTWGRSPLDHKDLARLGRLVSESPGGEKYGWNSVTDYCGGQLNEMMGKGILVINFSRPDQSECLKAFTDKTSPQYSEALELILKGRAMLEKHPRVDRSGCTPCEWDKKQLSNHAQRTAAAELVRQAMAEERKVYDK